MHTAPAVRYPVMRSGRAGALQAALWLPGAAAVAGWMASAPKLGPPQVLAAGLLLATAFACLRARRRSPPGQLGWDGQHWRWEGASSGPGLPEGTLSLHLDLQSLVLVRFRPARGGPLWLWLDRRALPGRWHALRCALHARVPAPDAVPAQPRRGVP
ncbi:hypothetical protein [Xylophilus sp. ASV27]|uniref:hypothetical protein n=1 Tax=Xylophilus sp. ASV27 TaxID=2795129 RepID=UPI0018EC34D6|nr:hypothetical protein [Xylophilus sp. ASV27]